MGNEEMLMMIRVLAWTFGITLFAIVVLWTAMALTQGAGCVRCDCIGAPSKCK